MPLQLQAPPSHMLPSISAAITQAVSELPPHAHGALVGVVTETGMNAAVVAKLDGNWSVQAWIGKTFGNDATNVGASVMKTW